MLWGACVQFRIGTRIGDGTHWTPDGSVTGDSPDHLLLRGPNLGSVGVDPTLNIVVRSQWDVPVQRSVNITCRLAGCQGLVRNMSRQPYFSRRGTGTGRISPYPVMRGTLVYLPCNSSRSG